MTEYESRVEFLFHALIEIKIPEQRKVFLDTECGDNGELRAEIEELLKSHQEVGSFLERPSSNETATILTDSDGDRAAAMEAGLAAAFDGRHSVVLGNAGRSVLKDLGSSLPLPQVELRDPAGGADPPVKTAQSSDVPQQYANTRYQVQGEIARGGMGAVLKGRDIDLRRDLAIKVLLDSHKDSPDVVRRFVEEAQIGGQLQHPGIVPVYELGQFSDHRPFFTMKLVKGETLAALLARRQDSDEDRVRFIGIFQQICQTMAYAHSRGVIHRDLKPTNVMVGAFGEVQVMDWGLAKVLPTGGAGGKRQTQEQQPAHSVIQTLRSHQESDPHGSPDDSDTSDSQTKMGSIMGTPAYMPPEQALGRIDQLDERADVFGLGAILCEILTGKPPYVGENGAIVYRMAARGKLEDCLQRLNQCQADEELIQLAKNCLALEPQDRPPNAGGLASRVT